MHARVTTFAIQAGKINAAVDNFESSTNDITGQPGNAGAYVLVDRATGEAMTVTLWESEEALQAAASAAAQVFSRAEDILAAPPVRRVYEVAASA